MSDARTGRALDAETPRKSIADPLITDARLEEIRLHVERGCSCAANVAAELVPEVDRLREHNAYLTDLFYGMTRYFGHLCETHAAVPMEQRDLSRVVVPACMGCQEDDVRALVAGNPEATTMARRLKESGERNIALMIENHRLRELLPDAPLIPLTGGTEA